MRTIADNTRTSGASILYEMRETVQHNFSLEHVWLAELHGVGDRDSMRRFTKANDMDRKHFNGSKVRIPIIPYELNAAGSISETGTVNSPIALDMDQAEVELARLIQPISITIDLEEDSVGEASAASMVGELVDRASTALARVENDQFLGNGDALLAAVTSNSGSAGLTIPVTSPNWSQLTPGRVIDVLTRSNGANPGNGLRRKITAVSRANSTITVSTSQVAADGDSGNVTFANTSGVYITGSYGTAAQGLTQAATVTGTFEAIDKAAEAWWQGTDGRSGTTTTAVLSSPMLEEGCELAREKGVYNWDFGIGDPRAINLYKQSLYSQVRYDAETSTLKSGFKGIVFDGAQAPIPLVKEPAHKPGSLRLVRKQDFQVYGRQKGPDFEDSTGAMWQRFSRALPKEAWLLDRVQLGVKRCDSIVFFNDLAVS